MSPTSDDAAGDADAPTEHLHALQETLRARDEFLAIAAHELRSPLNALGLHLALLERQAAQCGVASLAEEIARARRNVARYVRRAGTLLDVSRLVSGELLPERTPVLLREIVAAVMDTYADEARFHRVDLQARVEADALGHWDTRMVEEMLSNLVSNALRYGGGTPVRVRAGTDGPRVAWFEVADRGPGIDPAQRAQIFRKFGRAVSHSGDRGGFGLGLWITAGMAAAHRGGVELLATPPEGGAVFVIRLPIRAEKV